VSTRALTRALLALLFLVGSPAWAQQSTPVRTGTGVYGFVFDAESGVRLPGARVRVDGLARGTLTDSLGAFELGSLPSGSYLIIADQYGFEGLGISVTLGASATDALEFGLTPRPVMLEGLSVVSQRIELMQTRLRSRRNAAAVSTRAFGQDQLVRSASFDMIEFLRHEALVNPVPCGRRAVSNFCILRRGRSMQPRVFIDEAPVIGGLDQLGVYSPHELYLVEVYSQGLEIRAYTHMFRERMARRPMALIPIGVG